MGQYSVVKKEGNLTFCHSMGGPREYYAKLNISARERKYYMISNICGIKEESKQLFILYKTTYRQREQIDSFGHGSAG